MAADHEFNIEFVEEIEKYPSLYNFNLPEYMRKDTTEKAWAEIGDKFELTGTECKEKWKNLRSVFVRHLKPPKSGSTTTAPKRPYYLNDYMQFAIPFIKLAGSNSTETSNATQFTDEHNSSSQQTVYESEEPPRKKNFRKKDETPEEYIANYFRIKLAKICDSPESAEHASNKMFLQSVLTDMNKMNDKKTRLFKRRLLALVDEIMEE